MSRAPSADPREERFASEYAVDRNGTRAFLRAFGENATGGRRRSLAAAAEAARRLLKKPAVRELVKAALVAHRRACRVSARRVLDELAAAAFFDPIDVLADDDTGLPWVRPLAEMDPHARRQIARLSVRRRVVRDKARGEAVQVWVESLSVTFADKLTALDRLGRHLGLFKDGAALDELLGLLREDAAGKSRADLPHPAPALADAPDADVGP